MVVQNLKSLAQTCGRFSICRDAWSPTTITRAHINDYQHVSNYIQYVIIKLSCAYQFCVKVPVPWDVFSCSMSQEQPQSSGRANQPKHGHEADEHI